MQVILIRLIDEMFIINTSIFLLEDNCDMNGDMSSSVIDVIRFNKK